jgi:hypothetical protein
MVRRGYTTRILKRETCEESNSECQASDKSGGAASARPDSGTRRDSAAAESRRWRRGQAKSGSPCRGTGAFANMNATVEASWCSLAQMSAVGQRRIASTVRIPKLFCAALQAAVTVEGVCGVWLALPGFAGWRDTLTVSRAVCQSGPLVSSFRLGKFMKTLLAMAVGTVPLLVTGVSLAQNGNMMNGDGGMWGGGWMGGYGGIWGPILLVIVVAGLVAWVVKQKGK